MLSYTDYRFLYFLAKASKHIVAWFKLQILYSVKWAFLCPWCTLGSPPKAAVRCCYFSFIQLPHGDRDPLSRVLYPLETLLPPPTWLASWQVWDLKSLAPLISFLLKFAGALCECSGVVAGGRTQPPRLEAPLEQHLGRNFTRIFQPEPLAFCQMGLCQVTQ